MRTYKSTEKPALSAEAFDLQTDQPAACYYRQSTQMQVGNNSTAMQTVDLVEDMKRRGWKDDDILLIDMDEGFSGTLKIDERPGMSRLFGLISDGSIGTVACQDEDRLFRDVSQIQVNIFIDECRRNRVQVITPSISYSFHHPQRGQNDMRTFRFKCEMAAEYLNFLKTRLGGAKERLQRAGKWAGQRIASGYVADVRERINDQPNPNYQKYVPFEPFASVVLEIFRLFVEFDGNGYRTHQTLKARGVMFPSLDDCPLPDGFATNYEKKKRNPFPDVATIENIVTNAIYAGHFVYKGKIIHWNNHEAIVPLDLFTAAFNLASPYTLAGEPNPNYRPRKSVGRKKDVERSVDHPLCEGLIRVFFENEWKPAGVRFKASKYQYAVDHQNQKAGSLSWRRDAEYIDESVVYYLRERVLAAASIAETIRMLKDQVGAKASEHKLLSAEIDSIERRITNLEAKIEALTNLSLIGKLESRYTELTQERDRLIAKRERLPTNDSDTLTLMEKVADHLNSLETLEQQPYDVIRKLLVSLVEQISVKPTKAHGGLSVEIIWFDGDKTEYELPGKPNGAVRWHFTEVTCLKNEMERGTTRALLAALLPTKTWCEIRHQIWIRYGSVEIPGEGTIKKVETFADYVRRKYAFDADDISVYAVAGELGRDEYEIMVTGKDGGSLYLTSFGTRFPDDHMSSAILDNDVIDIQDGGAVLPLLSDDVTSVKLQEARNPHFQVFRQWHPRSSALPSQP